MRIRRVSGVVLLAMGLGLAMGPTGAGAADTAPPLVTSLETVTDGVGDVLNTVTSSLFDNNRADITQASVEWAPGWFRMKAQLRTPTDPLKDPAWSDANDLEWAFDTNGDGHEDYTVEFASNKGELYGAVFDASKPSDTSICDADSASFSPQDGYTLVIDPKCIGDPKSLGWAATMYFDTDPKDAKGPVASDRVPDQGFKAESAPGQTAPAGAPAPTAAPPVGPGPGAPVAAAPKAGAAPGPKSSAHAPGRTASGSVPSAAAAAAPGAAGTTPSPAPAGAGGTAAGVQPAAGPAALARTGSASEKNALFGLGLMLLGAGLLVMTRPVRCATGAYRAV